MPNDVKGEFIDVYGKTVVLGDRVRTTHRFGRLIGVSQEGYGTVVFKAGNGATNVKNVRFEDLTRARVQTEAPNPYGRPNANEDEATVGGQAIERLTRNVLEGEGAKRVAYAVLIAVRSQHGVFEEEHNGS